MSLFTLQHVCYKNIVTYPDMEIPNGGSTFISGESGAGKSILLKLLNGALSPSSGRIIYRGQSIESYDPIGLRREVLLVGQSVYLFDMSIRDNFKEFYAYRDMEAISDDEISAYLQICSVSLPLDAICGMLSGGERQRILIAIALSLPSNVFMLDEPTSALDSRNAYALMTNLREDCRKKGRTMLVVSHDKNIADTFADHMITLRGGVL